MLCIKFDRIEYKLSEQFELVAAVGESTRVRLVSQAEIQTPLGYLYMLQFNLRTVAATDHNKIQTSENEESSPWSRKMSPSPIFGYRNREIWLVEGSLFSCLRVAGVVCFGMLNHCSSEVCLTTEEDGYY